MKLNIFNRLGLGDRSRSARGAWIETKACVLLSIGFQCRAPPGARGLKQSVQNGKK